MPATARPPNPSSSSIGSALVSRKGGASSAAAAAGGGKGGEGSSRNRGAEDEDDGDALRARVVDVRNGFTSDGRRRLLSMAELFAEPAVRFFYFVYV